MIEERGAARASSASAATATFQRDELERLYGKSSLRADDGALGRDLLKRLDAIAGPLRQAPGLGEVRQPVRHLPITWCLTAGTCGSMEKLRACRPDKAMMDLGRREEVLLPPILVGETP